MTEDIENQIRLGLRLVAEELPGSPARTRLSRGMAMVAVALAAAVVAAAGVVAIADRGGGRPDYIQGHLGGPGEVALGYSVFPLSGISASSRGAAWIVGSAGRHALAWHWDGRAWRNLSPSNVPGILGLRSVVTVGSRDAWAVGLRTLPGHPPTPHAVIEHWDGDRWSADLLPKLGPSWLASVSATAPGNVWAAGATASPRNPRGEFGVAGTSGLLLHWDGSAWQRVAVPWARHEIPLNKVVATGPSSVWALTVPRAGQRLEYWNGKNWRAVPAPFGPDDPVVGFSATSATDAWAVGSYWQDGHTHALAAHWDGHSWQMTPVPNLRGMTESQLADVRAVRPNDVWAVGGTNWIRNDAMAAPVALFEHWNGRSWRIMRGPRRVLGSGAFVTVARDRSVWVAGSCYGGNVIFHRTARAGWTIVLHPRDVRWNPSLPLRLRHGRVSSCRLPARR